jgi:hypothetical protein
MIEAIPIIPTDNFGDESGDGNVLPTLAKSMNFAFGHMLKAGYDHGSEELTIQIGQAVAHFGRDGQLLGGESTRPSSR